MIRLVIWNKCWQHITKNAIKRITRTNHDNTSNFWETFCFWKKIWLQKKWCSLLNLKQNIVLSPCINPQTSSRHIMPVNICWYDVVCLGANFHPLHSPDKWHKFLSSNYFRRWTILGNFYRVNFSKGSSKLTNFSSSTLHQHLLKKQTSESKQTLKIFLFFSKYETVKEIIGFDTPSHFVSWSKDIKKACTYTNEGAWAALLS